MHTHTHAHTHTHTQLLIIMKRQNNKINNGVRRVYEEEKREPLKTLELSFQV